MKKQTGFTLIEIAIVLVIIGLLLGGVLKGQELITGARVRNVIQQQDGIKAAYFGFLDRYRALPGDYASAGANIPGMSASSCNSGNGDGNGKIEATGNENVLAWEQLSRAQFLSGAYACNATVSAATSPSNPYAQFMDIAYDASYAGTAQSRHNLKTGGAMPSDLLAEIDRKIDDGNANTGSYRAQVGGTVDSTTANCYDGSGNWASTTPGLNCGGATLY
jgi:prepilin-type N-terminal cleavage/methylation domain-containing protein